jgi:hypothetical protein
LEGRIQKTQKATTGPALVRDPFKIISILKKRIASLGLISHLEDLELTTTNLAERHLFFLKSNRKTLSTISRLPFSPFLTDFYISDSLSKNSTTMAKCSDSYRADFKNFF